MEFPWWLILFGSYLTFTWGIYRLFDGVGKTLRKKTRDHIAISLMGADLPKNLPNWPSMFVVLFDRVFTKKHLSWGCFFRSSVASVVVAAALTLAVAAVDASIIRKLSTGGIFYDVLFFAIGILLFNLLPDYLSLYETRLVLDFMAKSDARLRVPALLLFDLAATALISFVVGFLVLAPLFAIILENPPLTFTRLAEAFGEGLTFSGKSASAGIFIYSTFFTSVWVWLYALSGFLVKGIAASRTGLHFLQRHLNLEEHPLRSMGFVLMLLVTVGYVVWGLILVL